MLTPKGRSLLFIKEKGFSSENEDDDIHFQLYVLPDFQSVFNKTRIKQIEPTENIEAIQDIHFAYQDDKTNSDESGYDESSSDESDHNEENETEEDTDDR